jgi:hypothetical protein
MIMTIKMKLTELCEIAVPILSRESLLLNVVV